MKYSLPEKQKFSFNDKLFVSRYVRRLLTGHHCPQIGEGERGFFRQRREMKVGKSPQASNVCLLSWTMSPASHNSSGSRKRGGMTEGGRVQQESAGPSTLGPLTLRKHRRAPTRVAGRYQCEYPALGTLEETGALRLIVSTKAPRRKQNKIWKMAGKG